jgi:hypothetical protein
MFERGKEEGQNAGSDGQEKASADQSGYVRAVQFGPRFREANCGAERRRHRCAPLPSAAAGATIRAASAIERKNGKSHVDALPEPLHLPLRRASFCPPIAL